MQGRFEWYGSKAAGTYRVPSRHWTNPESVARCNGRHTAMFECTRAANHGGRHMAEGTTYVLAVWYDGGNFDGSARFTDAERKALDDDAAEAFF